jgi:TP901 family phage tail tape measure protein
MTAHLGAFSRAWVTVANTITSAMQKVLLWSIATGTIYGAIAALRSMVTIISDVDYAMTGLQKVYQGQAEDLSKMKDAAVSLAREYGANLTDVVNGMKEWARQGYLVSDAIELTRVALMAQNIAELEATQATQFLTAAMRQWRLETDQIEHVLDVWNELENRYAATTRDIAEGMARFGRTARNAGLTMEETSATVAVLVQNLRRSGNEIGRALRTLATYLYREKNIKALEEAGIAVMQFGRDGQKELKPFLEVIMELSLEWENLGSIQREQIAQAFGVRRVEEFRGVIESIPEILQATTDAYASHGSAARENLIFLESLRVKWGQFKAELQAIADSQVILNLFKSLTTGLIDMAQALSKVLSIMELEYEPPQITKSVKASEERLRVLKEEEQEAQNQIATARHQRRELAYLTRRYEKLSGVVNKTQKTKEDLADTLERIKTLLGPQATLLEDDLTPALEDVKDATKLWVDELAGVEDKFRAIRIESIKLQIEELTEAIELQRAELTSRDWYDRAKEVKEVLDDITSWEPGGEPWPAFRPADEGGIRKYKALSIALREAKLRLDQALEGPAAEPPEFDEDAWSDGEEAITRYTGALRSARNAVREMEQAMARAGAEGLAPWFQQLQRFQQGWEDLESRAKSALERIDEALDKELPKAVEEALIKARDELVKTLGDFTGMVPEEYAKRWSDALATFGEGQQAILHNIRQNHEALKELIDDVLKQDYGKLVDKQTANTLRNLQLLKEQLEGVKNIYAIRERQLQLETEITKARMGRGFEGSTSEYRRLLRVQEEANARLSKMLSYLSAYGRTVSEITRNLRAAGLDNLATMLLNMAVQAEKANRATLDFKQTLVDMRRDVLRTAAEDMGDLNTQLELLRKEFQEGFDERSRAKMIAAWKAILGLQREMRDLGREYQDFISDIRGGDIISDIARMQSEMQRTDISPEERMDSMRRLLDMERQLNDWYKDLIGTLRRAEMPREIDRVRDRIGELQKFFAEDEAAKWSERWREHLQEFVQIKTQYQEEWHSLVSSMSDDLAGAIIGALRGENITEAIAGMFGTIGEEYIRNLVEKHLVAINQAFAATMDIAAGSGLQELANVQLPDLTLKLTDNTTSLLDNTLKLVDNTRTLYDLSIAIRSWMESQGPLGMLAAQGIGGRAKPVTKEEIEGAIVGGAEEGVKAGIEQAQRDASAGARGAAGGAGAGAGGGGGVSPQTIYGGLMGGIGVYSAYRTGDVLSGIGAGMMLAPWLGPWGMAVGAVAGLLGKKKKRTTPQPRQPKYPGFWTPPDVMWSTTPYWQALPWQSFGFGRGYASPVTRDYMASQAPAGRGTVNIQINLNGTGYSSVDGRRIARAVEQVITRNAERENFSRVQPRV